MAGLAVERIKADYSDLRFTPFSPDPSADLVQQDKLVDGMPMCTLPVVCRSSWASSCSAPTTETCSPSTLAEPAFTAGFCYVVAEVGGDLLQARSLCRIVARARGSGRRHVGGCRPCRRRVRKRSSRSACSSAGNRRSRLQGGYRPAAETLRHAPEDPRRSSLTRAPVCECRVGVQRAVVAGQDADTLIVTLRQVICLRISMGGCNVAIRQIRTCAASRGTVGQSAAGCCLCEENTRRPGDTGRLRPPVVLGPLAGGRRDGTGSAKW
jgi:hypothetical protein